MGMIAFRDGKRDETLYPTQVFGCEPYEYFIRRAEGKTVLEAALTPDPFVREGIISNCFGLHVKIDAYNMDLRGSDIEYINVFMNTIPSAVGMSILVPANTTYYGGGEIPSDCGITSAVILAESHSSAHFFEKQNAFFFDLFSCKYFEPAELVKLVTEAFGSTDFDVDITLRGNRYNRSSRYRS